MRDPTVETEIQAPTSRASFAAIVIGALIAVLIDVAFGLLGAGLGLNTLPLQQGMDTSHRVATVGLAFVAGVLAFSAGGYIAGRLAPTEGNWSAAVHGIAAFALALFSVSYLTGNSNFGRLVIRAGIETGMGEPELLVIPAALQIGLAIANFVTLGLYLSGAVAAGLGGIAGMRAEIHFLRGARRAPSGSARDKAA